VATRGALAQERILRLGYRPRAGDTSQQPLAFRLD
jgi:hypothetical protein